MSTPARASTPGARLHAERWTTAEGLPGDTVRAVLQTRDGYLWVATQAGLARFDGVEFEVFDRRNTPAFRSDECVVLFEDSRGALWIGTIGGGLVRYRDGEFRSFDRTSGLPADTVLALYEDRRGRVWATSYDALSAIDGDRVETYTRADGISDVYAVPFLEDERGRLWLFNTRGLGVTTGGTLSAIVDGRIVAVDETNAPPRALAAAFHPIAPSTSGGALWIVRHGTREVVALDREGEPLFPAVAVPNDALLAAVAAPDGALWGAASDGAIVRVAGGEVSRIAPATRGASGDESRAATRAATRVATRVAPRVAPRVAALAVDREGNLWGGSSDGLVRFRPQPFATYGVADGLSNDRAWTVIEDRRGDLWVGTDSGLSRLSDEGWRVYTPRDGLAGGAVVGAAEAPDGALWFATTEGLSRFDGRQFRSFTTADGLQANNIRGVCVSRSGRVWVATTGGLDALDGDRVSSISARDGLPGGGALFVYEDRSDGVWVATRSGLARWNGSRFESFADRGLPAALVISAGESADGTLYVGTLGAGLYRFDGERFAAVASSPDLVADTITCILDDAEGSLWLGTLRGVCRARAAGDGRPLECTWYGTSDGLGSTDCGGGTQPAGWRARDGRLWFPTARGISVVDPRAIRVNAVVPPVLVESAVVDGVEMATSAPLEIGADARAVEVRYTALSFSDPLRVRFRYKLEGFDDAWVEAGARRSAFFTNLAPGSYRFRVVAANDDGLWNDEGASLELRIAPHFYQTVWFALLVAAALSAAVWSLYRVRVRVIRREFAAVLAERNRIARDLHDSLAQGLTSVSMQLEALGAKLDDAASPAREHLDRARLLVRMSLAEARRTVRDLRSESLEGGLGPALEAIARSLTEGTGVVVEVRSSGAPRTLGSAAETALLRAGQEALTNAVRHARASRVWVRIAYTHRGASIEVRDDGRGFDVSAVGPGGFGLRGMRERVEEAGGRIEIRSRPGRGTLLRAWAPDARRQTPERA
jgi:signal transduction histidine kinase